MKNNKTKTKKESIDSKVKILTDKVKNLEDNKDLLETNIELLKKEINKLEYKLTSFINKHTSQIRVLEKDGKWGGYTGVFHLDPKDNKRRVIKKAVDHYERYFKNVDFYKNRTLGLFITNNKERKLIKILQESRKENNGK